MPTKKLTAEGVAKLTPPPSGRLEVHDSLCPGFGVRVMPSGKRTFYVLYRIAGDRLKRRLTIGELGPSLGVGEARQAARDALAMAAEGRDPALARRAAVAENRRQDAVLEAGAFDRVAAAFLEHHASQLRGGAEVARLVSRHLVPTFTGRQTSTITRAELVGLIDTMATTAPVQANRLHAWTRRLFGWSAERGYIETNPLLGVRAPARERPRDRVLSDDEVVAIWRAAKVTPYPFGPLVRLLMLTGCRVGELAKLTRSQLREDAITWTETKNGRGFALPMVPMVAEVLAGLPPSEPYVFSTTKGKKPSVPGDKWKRKLDEDAGVTGWTIHDIRRTVATNCARLGVAPHVVEAMLNHKSGVVSGIARVYNTHAYQPEVRAALLAWHEHLRTLTGETETQEAAA